MLLKTTTLEVEDDLGLLFPHTKTGVLGGTFNPFHNGHLDMALAAYREFDLQKVMIVPVGDPPHKDDSGLVSAQKRLHMAAIAAYGHPELEVSDMELKREGPSYTVDTAEQLLERFSNIDFYFIIGSDSLFEMETWMRFGELCRKVRFICVQRVGHDRLAMAAQAARLAEQYDAVIEISQHTGLDISSTAIRRRIAEGEPITGMVPPAVEEYIYESGLYQ